MVVPTDWKELEISELCVPQKSRIDPRVSGGGDICVELEHIAGGSGQLLGVTNTSGTSSLKTKFEPGDVLFGKLRAYLRKYWLAEFAGVCSTEIWALSANRTRVVPGFLVQIVRTEDFIEAASVSYGTHMPRSDWSIVSKLIVSVPPLKEQEAIAEALSDADAAIESLNALIVKKRDVKQATMQQLLNGRTRLPGFTADWNWKTLGEVTSLIPGGVYGEESPHSQLIGMPVATTAHIEMSDRWNDKEMSIRYFSKEQILTYAPQFGDLIVVKSSGSAASIQSGKLGFVDIGRAGKFIFSNFLMLLRPVNVLPKFLYYYVSSHNVKRLIPTLVEASTYPNIRIPEYLQVQICVPPLKEQEAIAEALTVMDDELEALTEQVSKLRMVKEGMMQDLLTGKVRLV